jgi:toxin YoeB
MKKIWHDRAWDEYLDWQHRDRKLLKRVNDLLRDIEREPFAGLGKPEPLRHELSGWWSRRIDEHNRVVYRLADGQLEILQCGSHYRDV